MNDSISRATYDQVMIPNYVPADFIPVRGLGSRVWDQEGREYIDFAGGIAVNGLGHCHPELVDALTEQAGKLWHVSNVFTNEPVLRLARRMTELTFAERCFFCNSGAEANEAAFKLARKFASDHFGPEKNEIVACHNAFHGRTLFTVTVGGKYTEGLAPLPGGIQHIVFNDIASLEAAVTDRTCAVVIEPIQGEGGVMPADPAFIQAARDVCDRHDALLIFDEVQCGMGRTGELYAYMYYGVAPDIMTTAKALGGGFPIGGILTTERVAASFGPGTHGSTYGGNPLACAVALRALDIISRPEVLAGVRQRHDRLVAGLVALNGKHGVFKAFRGRGLLLGAVLSDAYAGRAREVVKAAERQGLMLLVAGADVVRMAPALIISEEEIAAGLSRLDAALDDLATTL